MESLLGQAVSFATDFLAIIILFGVFFAIAWWRGMNVLASLIFSLYGAYALYIFFPYSETILSWGSTSLTTLTISLGLFAFFTAIFYFTLRRVVSADYILGGRHLAVGILSFFITTFIVVLAYHVFPVRDVYTFTPAIDSLFASKQFFFWWFVAPLVGLFIFTR